MRNPIWIVVLALMSSPAMAKDVTLTLNDQEQAQLLALLDLAAKQGGLNAASAVAYFAQKMRQSSEPEIHPPAPPSTEGPKP